MPRKSTKSKTPTKTSSKAKTNGAGEVISWSTTLSDGKFLNLLVEQGIIDGYTASNLKKEYSQFKKYANRTLASALGNTCRRLSKEVDVRKQRGSA
eukprot:12124575-Ditylum_brightwellii.AAC.1